MAGFYILILNQALTPVIKHAGIRIFALGACFGMGWFSGVAWVYVTLERFGGLSSSLAAMATLLFCGYLALFPALMGLIFRCFLQRAPIYFDSPLPRALLFAHVWTIAEVLRGTLFSGFPWLALGYAHATEGMFSWLSLSFLAPWIGWLGLSWMSAWCAALIGEWVLWLWGIKRRFISPSHHLFWRTLMGMSVVTIVVLDITHTTSKWTHPTLEPQRFQLIQGNVPIRLKWDEDLYAQNLQRFRNLIKDSPDIVTVLPETAVSVFDHPISQRFMQSFKGNLVVGGIERSSNHDLYNSIALVIPNVNELQTYRKKHLVPFGEYTPLGFAWFAKTLNIPMANLKAGEDSQKPLVINGMPVTVAICYENLYPNEWRDMMNHSNLLINASNTGWYGDSWAMPQHLQISVMRALEMQKPVLHVADTGITAVIDANGKIVDRIPALTSGRLEANVQGYEGITPYQRWGDKLIFLWITLTTLLMVAANFRVR